MGPDLSAEAVHQAGLERSIGRIFATFMVLMVRHPSRSAELRVFL